MNRIKYGKFNVSFQIFKNDIIGLNCLEFWRKQCIEWCKDFLDEKNNRFADQKYLDYWPQLYNKKIKILDDNISGIAPWNINNYKISLDNGNYFSNNERIIFYHFHNFKIINKNIATNGFYYYNVKNQKAVDFLYLQYWDKLVEIENKLDLVNDNNIRHISHKNLFIRLLEENTFYYKFNNDVILHIHFKFIPKIFKKIIITIYGRINIFQNS